MTHRSLSLLALFSWSCSTGRAVLDAEEYQDLNDTGASSNTDTDTDADTDTDTDTDTEEEDQPDFSVWNGTRTFEYDANWDDYDCEDEVAEEGKEITSGRAYNAIIDECPKCDHVYEVEVSPDEICGWIGIDTYTYRGLIIDGNTMEVWRFEMEDGDLQTAYALTEDGEFDGWSLEYHYESELYESPLYVDGFVDFPVKN